MNYLKNFIIFPLWTLILILFYIFLFSDAGYFAIKKKILYKQLLQQEIDSLTKENQNLEEKLILNRFTKEDYKLIILKMNHSDSSKEKLWNQRSFSKNYSHFFLNPYDSYFYLYVFIGFLGYLYLIFLHLKKVHRKDGNFGNTK